MKKCLVVVDYQNDFVIGSLGFPEAEAIEGKIVEKIRAYRERGDEVVFTMDTHGTDYIETQEGRILPVIHCVKGTEGHRLFGRVAKELQESDMRFWKDTFGSDGLYMYLTEQPFDSIELAGVVSNICVLANVVLAKTAQPETTIIVDARCVASNDPRLNQEALDVMESLQVHVLGRQSSGSSE